MNWLKNLWSILATNLADGMEKSTVGTIVMFGCLLLIAKLTFTEGGSDTVADLITTAMIVAATLMGVNSVTDIFKPRCRNKRQQELSERGDDKYSF